MIKILFYHLIYFIFLYLVSFILYDNVNISKIVIPIIAFYFLFSKYKDYKSIFIKIKALIVLLPIIFYPYYSLIYKNTKSIFFTSVLFINLLQVSLMLGLNSDEYLTKLNGLNLLILSILTPILNNYNSDYLKFDKNNLWGYSKTIILLNTYLFNDFYYQNIWKYAGIYSIIIPSIHTFLTKNSKAWISLRIYSLVLSFFIDSTYPLIHKNMVTELNKIFTPSTDKFDGLKSIFSIIEVIMIFFLVKNINNNTFLDYCKEKISKNIFL